MVQIFVFGVSHVIAVKKGGDFKNLLHQNASSDTMKVSSYKRTQQSQEITVQSGGHYILDWSKWASGQGFNWRFLNEDRWIYYGSEECQKFYDLMKEAWIPLLQKFEIGLDKLTKIVDIFEEDKSEPELSFYYRIMSAFKLGANNGFVAIIS